MCLWAAIELASHGATRALPNCVFLSVGTDGQDGPTDAAGAVVTAGTLESAVDLAAARDALAACDSHTYFAQKHPDVLIRTGLTGTNVMDIQIVLLQREEN